MPKATGGVNHRETADLVPPVQPGTLIGFNHGDPAGEISLREKRYSGTNRRGRGHPVQQGERGKSTRAIS